MVSGSDRFPLTNDIWVERLDENTAKNIQQACEPPHYKIDNYIRDRHLYGFVQRDDNARAPEDLFTMAALSRLIYPTSRYCAKVYHFGVNDSPIQALVFGDINPDAIISSSHRDWLSIADAENLRRLMPWLRKDKRMHPRVHRAYWNHEYAMRSLYLDARWLVVAGLEALINVREQDNKRQFCNRAKQLAVEFEVSLDFNDLALAYKLRSKLIHGEDFLHGLERILPRSEHHDLYERLESLLRLTVRRCLLDESFGANFRDDAAVEARCPV